MGLLYMSRELQASHGVKLQFAGQFTANGMAMTHTGRAAKAMPA